MLSRRDALIALAGITPAWAQRSGATFSADVDVVNVLATVLDQRGRLVKGLSRDDFSILEDGRPQPIRYFAAETGLPLTLGLLIDTSGSQVPVLSWEQRASFKFLSQVLRPAKDQAFVIRFDTQVELLHPMTGSREELQVALAGLNGPERRATYDARRDGTKLFDAIVHASEQVLKNQPGRKALIVLSDGGDTSSRAGIDQAIEAAERDDVLVYTILFSGLMAAHLPLGRRPVIFAKGRAVLEQISRETGGGAFEVSKQDPIEGIYARIDEDLRNQYSLGFTPESRGSGPRKLEVRIGRKNCIVRTRTQYFGTK